MRFSVASGTDNSLLQGIVNQTTLIEAYTKPNGLAGYVPRHLAYSSIIVSPHAATTRITYTVPAGKIGILKHYVLDIERISAAAPAGRADCTLIITTSAGGLTIVDKIRSSGNTLGLLGRVSLGLVLVLEATDVIEIRTSDLSTGGTLDFMSSFFIAEIDA